MLAALERMLVSMGAPPRYVIPDDLRAAINEVIARRGRVVSELARQLKCKPGAIEQIRDGSTKSSHLIPSLCDLLAIQWVRYIVPDDLHRRVIGAIENVKRTAGREAAEEMATEVERLARRIIAEALHATTVP